MSRYNYIIIFFLGFLVYGCTTHVQPRNIFINQDIQPVVNNEDFQSLKALNYQYIDDNKTKALELYSQLYNDTQKLPYLIEAIKLSFATNNIVLTNKLLADGRNKFPDNENIMRMEVKRLVEAKEYNKARDIIQKLIKKNNTTQNNIILASIYTKQKKYLQALKIYKNLYKKNYNEKILLKMAVLLYEDMNRKKEAISYLESHIRLKNASIKPYQMLLYYYGENMNIDGLISTYKLLYNKFNNESYAKKIIELYIYKKNKQGAIDFLKTSGFKPQILIDLYVKDERFQDAKKLAENLYKKNGNILYLGQAAIYEYEANKDSLTQKKLQSISKKFDAVIEQMQIPLYLNYYGYLLIDHNIDIKKGIKYVQMAVKKEPTSVYYVDSLAWGYYKLKKCKKALEIMKNIINKTNEPEVKEHYNIIKKCAKKQQ